MHTQTNISSPDNNSTNSKSNLLKPQSQENDTTVAGFVLQSHLQLLTSFFFHLEAKLRYAISEFIGVMLKQGLLCPLDVISYFIALQVDNTIGK